jgi:hypothetical protein
VSLLSGAVAIGVAATAAAVARRRVQQAHCALLLEAWAGTAFAYYPGFAEPSQDES